MHQIFFAGCYIARAGRRALACMVALSYFFIAVLVKNDFPAGILLVKAFPSGIMLLYVCVLGLALL